jgi:uncharacterized membrane protein
MEIDEPDFDEDGPDVAESVGPIQLWSVAFEGNQFRGEILPELERLKREGIVRIIDLLFVRKDSEGAVMVSTQSDLEWAEAVSLGAYLGSLAGYVESGAEGFDSGAIAGAAELADGHFFDSDDIFQLTQALPEGTSAAIALLEHLWAKPLLEAIDRANGTELESRLLRPEQVFTPDKLSRARKPELGGA